MQFWIFSQKQFLNKFPKLFKFRVLLVTIFMRRTWCRATPVRRSPGHNNMIPHARALLNCLSDTPCVGSEGVNLHQRNTHV